MDNKYTKLLALASVLILGFGACKSSGGGDDPAPTTAKLAEDIPANVNTLIGGFADDVQDHPGEAGKFTFYNLDIGDTISDSLSSDWDIAFNGSTIVANSENGGGIQIIEAAYASVTEAPTTGFSDTNASWYNYTGEAPTGPKHAILPKENTTLIVKTSEGNYAKIEILSYYKGNPDTSTDEFANLATRPASGYFTFNYTLQTDGTAKLFHVDSYTFFDFETSETVEDSLSSQWDLGFNATTIIANSGNGGGVQLLNIEFELVDEAPVSGYEATLAEKWYNYTGEAASGPKHAILPIEGKTLVVKTADEKYAKVRIISYYKGNPDTSSEDFANFIRPTDRYYTIEFAIQTDGSRFFNND